MTVSGWAVGLSVSGNIDVPILSQPERLNSIPSNTHTIFIDFNIFISMFMTKGGQRTDTATPLPIRYDSVTPVRQSLIIDTEEKD